jgi:hypothetical protein
MSFDLLEKGKKPLEESISELEIIRFRNLNRHGGLLKMSYIQVLKTSKSYAVPFVQITWSISRHTLNLEAVIDVQKHDAGGLDLPPTELGQCKDWCLKRGEGVYDFSACWDIRRVKDSLHLTEIVNSKIEPYAAHREPSE